MLHDFAQLLVFYDRRGPDVMGRGLGYMKGDETALIERFIAGQCDEPERRQLVQILLLQPHLIRQIAERIKVEREDVEDSTTGFCG